MKRNVYEILSSLDPEIRLADLPSQEREALGESIQDFLNDPHALFCESPTTLHDIISVRSRFAE